MRVEGNGVQAERRAAWSWPAVPECVPVARRAVVAYLCEDRARGCAVDDIAVAVSEALTNVVLHAYTPRDSHALFHVVVELSGDAVVIVVSDDGRGIVPRTDSPGLGLGMPLMATLSDGLQF